MRQQTAEKKEKKNTRGEEDEAMTVFNLEIQSSTAASDRRASLKFCCCWTVVEESFGTPLRFNSSYRCLIFTFCCVVMALTSSESCKEIAAAAAWSAPVRKTSEQQRRPDGLPGINSSHSQLIPPLSQHSCTHTKTQTGILHE